MCVLYSEYLNVVNVPIIIRDLYRYFYSTV
nr:MAG TPA: hypothetical protein [Caudoviricetes sp.]DAH37547.1 MAG TPA: hypothetical protein [Caudoviricetes sp.]